MVLKLYIDRLSQPSRALKLFVTACKIPHEECSIDIGMGAHKQEPFLNINRFGRLPAIDDDGFKLSESVAIVRYIARKNKINNNWYPQDIKLQAAVDEFLEWQHLDLRATLAMYFRMKVIVPLFTGKHPTEEALAAQIKRMNNSLDKVEKLWLGDGRPYLVGNQISVADLFAACEIEQPRVAGFDCCQGRPVLTAWLQRVRSDLEPHYTDVHQKLNSFLQEKGGKSTKSSSKL